MKTMKWREKSKKRGRGEPGAVRSSARQRGPAAAHRGTKLQRLAVFAWLDAGFLSVASRAMRKKQRESGLWCSELAKRAMLLKQKGTPAGTNHRPLSTHGLGHWARIPAGIRGSKGGLRFLFETKFKSIPTQLKF